MPVPTIAGAKAGVVGLAVAALAFAVDLKLTGRPDAGTAVGIGFVAAVLVQLWDAFFRSSPNPGPNPSPNPAPKSNPNPDPGGGP